MKKKFLLLPLFALGLFSCTISTKSVTLSGALVEKSFQENAGLDGSSAFDVDFKNFVLTKGGIHLRPAYRQNSSASDEATIASVETGLKPLVKVTASQSFFDAGFNVTYSGNKISCSFSSPYRFDGTEVTIDVYANARSISLSGGSALTLDVSRSSSLDLDITGSSSISFEKALALSSLALSVSGSADFEASGIATSVRYQVSGTASIKSKELLSEDVKIDISGSGNAVVSASKTLAVNIAGVGNVTYYGDPAITRSISGIGNLSKGN
jgi:hypothetical protein